MVGGRRGNHEARMASPTRPAPLTMNSEVNRADRNALIEVTSLYLREELTAFAFDEKLSEIEARTNDETVKWVRSQLWGFYDDCTDHKVVGSKPEWDMIQRLVLLLQSDATVAMETGPAKWTARQAVAAAGLGAAAWIVWQAGWGSHLLIFNMPLGLVSMGLSFWRGRAERESTVVSGALAPFGSLAELRSIRRSVRNFVKPRYPGRLAQRRIRSPLADWANWIYSGAFWLMFSPVALAFQLRPERRTTWRVTTP